MKEDGKKWFVGIHTTIQSEVEQEIPVFVQAETQEEAEKMLKEMHYTVVGRLKTAEGFEGMVKKVDGYDGCWWVPRFGGVWMIGESLAGCVERLTSGEAKVVEIVC